MGMPMAFLGSRKGGGDVREVVEEVREVRDSLEVLYWLLRMRIFSPASCLVWARRLTNSLNFFRFSSFVAGSVRYFLKCLTTSLFFTLPPFSRKN